MPSHSVWLPYLGPTLDAGIATLFAEEMIVALRYLHGTEPQADCNGFFTDTIMRTWGSNWWTAECPVLPRSSGRRRTRRLP